MTSPPALPLDWNLLRLFLAAAQEGSLGGAARTLGLSQPTLSRQVAALEAQLGLALFERTRRGLRLTAAGQALRPAAERMARAAADLARGAAARDTTLAGTVRLTASEIVSTWLLPPVLASLAERHPEIQIEVVPSDTLEDLLEREADVALRMVRPTEAALVARKLGDWPLALYASTGYVARHGLPTVDTLNRHRWIGMDRSRQMLDGFRAAGFEVGREFFALRSDHPLFNWQAVQAGLGIGVGLQRVAAGVPNLVQVLPALPLPALPVWLTAHRELQGVPRLRVVFDALATAFGPAPG